MDFINENIIKCLKQEIDAYRDKYAIALQEIKELNYFSKEDNDKLKAELSKFQSGNAKEYVDKLKAENKQLTQTIKYSNGNDGLYDEVVESNEHLEGVINDLKEENERLNSLNKPKILSGGIDEGSDNEPTKH